MTDAPRPARQRRAMGLVMRDAFEMFTRAKKHWAENRQTKGSVECLCGGTLNYVVASVNEHMHARCDTCTIGWME